MKTISGILLASTMLVAPAIAQSQQSSDRTQGAQQQQQSRSASTAISAQEFARQAGIANLAEIETSQIALKRSSNEDVRAYANQMVKDHQNALRRLRTAASDQNVPTSLEGQYSRFLQDMRETDNFDQEYIESQIEAHQDAIDLFENYSQAGQHRNLRQFAQQTLPTFRRHLRMAENLMGGDDAQAQAQRDGRSQQSANQRQNRTASARVMVQQRAPEVTVDQAQPQIIVRQPPPTITLQQAQPEIIVRMPPPTVDVSTQRPQVSLRMAQPTVSVNREGQQRVRINRAEQPNITFERTGEPRIQVREAQGQPRIRYEQTDRSGNQQHARANQADQRNAQRAQGSQQRSSMTAAERRQADMDDENRTTGTVGAQQSRSGQNTQMENNRLWILEAQRLSATDGSAPTSGETQMMIVGNLLNESVYNGRGQELGTIERVVQDATTDRDFVVLANGGFLGLFEDTAAVPIQRLRYENGRLVIRGLTEQDIETMPNWEERVPNARDLRNDAQLDVTTAS